VKQLQGGLTALSNDMKDVSKRLEDVAKDGKETRRIVMELHDDLHRKA